MPIILSIATLESSRATLMIDDPDPGRPAATGLDGHHNYNRLKTGVVGSASMDVCVPSRRYVVYIIFFIL